MPTDIASFNAASSQGISLSAPTTLNGLTFISGDFILGSPARTNLILNGAGITSNSGSIQLSNYDSGATVFNNSSSAGYATIANSFLGSTSFNNSSTAANAKIANSGTLIGGGIVFFNNASTAGNAAIDNEGSSRLTFSDASSGGQAVITNTGSTSRSAIASFQNTSTAGQATITNSGTGFGEGITSFEGGSTAGNATLTNNNYGVTSFVGTSLAGHATITNNTSSDLGSTFHSGRTTFANAASADHATLINNGAQLGGGNTAFTDASTAGEATIINHNGGLTTFSGTSTAGNAALINDSGGTVDMSGLSSSGLTAGSIAGAGSYILGSKSLTVGSNGLDTTVSGVISGTDGSLVKTGAGTLILTGANTYSGGTTVSAGTLQGNSISLQGDILNNASLVFDQGPNGSYAGLMSGSGSLTKINSGMLTLAGANTYAGGTFIRGGVLQAGAPNVFGTGRITMTNATLFDLNSQNQIIGSLADDASGTHVTLGQAALTTGGDNTDSLYSGIISGAGSLVKTGAGTFTLAGANTYTGGTVLNGGTLIILSPGSRPGVPSIVPSVSQAQSASPLGSGDFTLNSGTLKAAGSNFGVIPVRGNYFQNGGTLALKVGGGSSMGQSDRLQVGGVAHIGGKLQLDLTGGGFTPGKGTTLQLVQASSIQGDFDFLSGTAGLGLTFDPTTGGLNVSQNPFVPSAVTANQQAVAANVDQFAQTATGDLQTIVAGLDTLSASAVPSALNELSPQRYEMYSEVAFRTAAFTAEEMNSHLSRLRSGSTGMDLAGMLPNSGHRAEALLAGGGQGGASSSYSVTHNLGAFVSGQAIFGKQEATPDLQKSNFTTSGTMGGLDYRLTDHVAAGVLFSYAHTEADLDEEGSRSTIHSYSPGLYATYFQGPFYWDAMAAYGRNSYSSDRNVIFAGINRTAHGDTQGKQLSVNSDTGYDFKTRHFGVGPTLGLTYVKLNVDGFTETGADAANLTVSEQRSDSLTTRLGTKLDRPIAMKTMSLVPEVRVAWQHEYLDNRRNITATLNQPGTSFFSVQTTSPQRDSALLGAGLTVQLSRTIDLYANYAVQVGQKNFIAQGIQGGGRLRF